MISNDLSLILIYSGRSNNKIFILWCAQIYCYKNLVLKNVYAAVVRSQRIVWEREKDMRRHKALINFCTLLFFFTFPIPNSFYYFFSTTFVPLFNSRFTIPALFFIFMDSKIEYSNSPLPNPWNESTHTERE